MSTTINKLTIDLGTQFSITLTWIKANQYSIVYSSSIYDH